jgi:hypothetical protein
MTFANPIALAALAGILVPLAIHLLSRKEGKVIRIGSLRHLEETSTRQFKSLKLNEVLLLALRSLLIVWLALWLSGAQWNNGETHGQKWLLIEPGLEHEASLTKITDSLTAQGYEVRAWANEFPLLKDSTATPPQDYWTLTEALEKKPLSEVVIFSANRAQAFQGRRIALPEHIRWISAPLPFHKFNLTAVEIAGDSVWLRTGTSSADGTTFETRKQHRREVMDTLTHLNTIRVAFCIDPPYAYDGKIIHAALATLQQSLPDGIDITSVTGATLPDAGIDWVIWLRDEPLPATPAQSIALNTHIPGKFIQQKEPGRWIINRRLLPDMAVRENLTLLLANIIAPHRPLWETAGKYDRRMIDDRQAVHRASTAGRTGQVTTAEPTLWIWLTLITLVAERFAAYRRNQ